MALSQSRCRNQTTLTKLATRVASVHGELAYVEGRLGAKLQAQLREGLERRRGQLLEAREALYVTLRQFDPALDPSAIGMVEDWLKPFGRGLAAKKRYEAGLLQGASVPLGAERSGCQP